MKPDFSGPQAFEAVRRIAAAAEAAGMPTAIAIVDAYGFLAAAYRMDGAHPRYMNVAIRKAYTAAVREQNTETMHEEVVRRSMDLANYGDPMFTTLPGGIVVRGADGGTIAGIGVTGRTQGRDGEFARAGIPALDPRGSTPD